VQFFALSPFFASLFYFSSKKKMDTTLEKLKSIFPLCLRMQLQKFTVLGVKD
jgi:hypothetical protein